MTKPSRHLEKRGSRIFLADNIHPKTVVFGLKPSAFSDRLSAKALKKLSAEC